MSILRDIAYSLLYTGSPFCSPIVMEHILEPELFSKNFGPYITPDPISLDLWIYLKEHFVAEHCFQIQLMYSVCTRLTQLYLLVEYKVFST